MKHQIKLPQGTAAAAANHPSLRPTPQHNQALMTEEEFKEALPPHMKKRVNKTLIQNINKVLADPKCLDFLKDNLLSYTSVMREGKFKITQYLAAVHYVSHKLLGCTNMDAYIKTFPGKYKRFLAQGVDPKDIASYATAYNKSKLVNLIFEQTLVPAYVLNAPLYQQALNVQADLMMHARSEKVRSDAANSILTQLKPPEAKKIELDIGVRHDATVEELKRTTEKLVAQQKAMMQNGVLTAEEIAELPIANGRTVNSD